MSNDVTNRVKLVISRHLSSPATSETVEGDVLAELGRIIYRGYGADVLAGIKEPFKHGVPLMQTKSLILLDQLIRNAPPDFAMMVASEDWTERLFRVSKTTTSADVADRIMLAVLGWHNKYPVNGFEALIVRFRESKVVGQRFLYLVGEFHRSQRAQQQLQQQQQQPQQQQQAAQATNAPSPTRQGYYVDPASSTTMSTAAAAPLARNSSGTHTRRPQQRVNLDTLLMDAQGDMAALEYGIQHPDMLNGETARDCSKHKAAITRLLENPAVEIADEDRNTCLLVLEQLVTLLSFHDAMYGTTYNGAPAAAQPARSVPSPQARDADDDDADLQAALRESSMQYNNTPQSQSRQWQQQPQPQQQSSAVVPVASNDFDVFGSAPNPPPPTFGSPVVVRPNQSGTFAAANTAELEEQRRQVAALNSENSSLQARVRTAEQEKADLEAELAKAKAQAESLQKKLASAKEKNSLALEAGQKLDEELQAATERIRQLETALAERSSAPPPPPEIRIKEVIREVKPKVDGRVLKQIQTDLTELRSLQSAVRKEGRTFASLADQFVADFRPKIDQIFTAAFADRQKDQQELRALQALYKKEVQRRKEYYNQIQELKGNIRVYCRIRPMSSKELADGHEDITSFPSEEEIRIVDDKQKIRSYEFDCVFGPSSTQDQVFADTMPLIDSVVDGYNVCIFAYGQTGSGKTHTMNGSPDNPGINRRALQRLFEVLKEREGTEECAVRVSVLEIYNESIRDLLVPRKELAKSYDIHSGGKYGQYVSNLKEEIVETADAINEIMVRASSNRTEGATNMNAHSSRSHMIVYIIVTSTNKTTGAQSYGKLSLVDLAGSERLDKSGAEGAAAKEAVAINKSLTALGDTIASLSQATKHVPYRNSTLTHLLQDSMSGQAKVLMFCCASPASYNTQETISSLTFALRARGVSLGQVKKNA